MQDLAFNFLAYAMGIFVGMLIRRNAAKAAEYRAARLEAACRTAIPLETFWTNHDVAKRTADRKPLSTAISELPEKQ